MEQKHSGSGDNIAGDKHVHLHYHNTPQEIIEIPTINIELSQENELLYTEKELVSITYDLIEFSQSYVEESRNFKVNCFIPKNEIFKEKLNQMKKQDKLQLQTYLFMKEKDLSCIGIAIKILFVGYVKIYGAIVTKDIILAFKELIKLYHEDINNTNRDFVKLHLWQETKSKKDISTFAYINKEELKMLMLQEVDFVYLKFEYVSQLPSKILFKSVIPSISKGLSCKIFSNNEDFKEKIKYFSLGNWCVGLR